MEESKHLFEATPNCSVSLVKLTPYGRSYGTVPNIARLFVFPLAVSAFPIFSVIQSRPLASASTNLILGKSKFRHHLCLCPFSFCSSSLPYFSFPFCPFCPFYPFYPSCPSSPFCSFFPSFDVCALHDYRYRCWNPNLSRVCAFWP